MDPTTGRFASKDPFEGNFEIPATLHRYLYANANPVNFRDPSGYFTLSELSQVNAMIGNLTRLAQPILRAVDIVEAGVDILQAVNMIGNIVLNGGALPPNVQQQLANQFNNRNFLDFGNEAAQAFGENVARLTSRVVDQWKFYLLGMGAQGQDIKALLLYMPNLIGGPQLPPIPVRRGRLPMEVVFGGVNLHIILPNNFTLN